MQEFAAGIAEDEDKDFKGRREKGKRNSGVLNVV